MWWGTEQQTRRCDDYGDRETGSSRVVWSSWTVEWKDSDVWVFACRNFEVSGPKSKGRSKKTWDECVRHNLRSGLTSEWTQNKTLWKSLIVGKSSNPCMHEEADASYRRTMKRTLNGDDDDDLAAFGIDLSINQSIDWTSYIYVWHFCITHYLFACGSFHIRSASGGNLTISEFGAKITTHSPEIKYQISAQYLL